MQQHVGEGSFSFKSQTFSVWFISWRMWIDLCPGKTTAILIIHIMDNPFLWNKYILFLHVMVVVYYWEPNMKKYCNQLKLKEECRGQMQWCKLEYDQEARDNLKRMWHTCFLFLIHDGIKNGRSTANKAQVGGMQVWGCVDGGRWEWKLLDGWMRPLFFPCVRAADSHTTTVGNHQQGGSQIQFP